MLWVRIANPEDPARHSYPILAKVDTGTDVSIFPAGVAVDIDLDITHGEEAKVVGAVADAGGRVSKAKIEILKPDLSPMSGMTQTCDICFVQGCRQFILGANFLRSFVLTFDFPNEVFSIVSL